MQTSFSFRVLIFLIASMLGGILFVSTPWGLGTSPDSVGYLKGAIGMLNGVGLTQFSSNWPPLYPTMLALFGWSVGGDVFFGARLLHAILFASNFLLIVQILLRMKLPGYLAFVLGILIAVHHVLTYVQFYAWSEPAFITVLLVSLLTLSRLTSRLYSNQKTLHIEIMLATLAGLAILLRYAAVALIISNLSVLLILMRHHSWKIKLRVTSLQIVLPALMLLPWLGFNILRSQSATQRTLAQHFPDSEFLKKGVSAIGSWFTSGVLNHTSSLQFYIGALLIVLCIAVLIWAIFKGIQSDAVNLIFISSIFTLTYLLFLFFSISFIDVATPLDDRILSPIFVCIALMLAGLSRCVVPGNLRIVVIIGLIVSLGLSALQIKSRLLVNYYNGVELTSKTIRERPIVKFIQTCSPRAVLASDTPWDFDLYLQTKAIWLPRLTNFTSGLDNKNYAQEIQSLESSVDIIVVTNLSSLYLNEIESLKLFNSIYRGSDGAVWINQKTMRLPCLLLQSAQ